MHAAAMVFPNGVLCFARVPASIKPKLGVSIFSQKEIADGSLLFASRRKLIQSTVLSIRSEGSRRGRPRRNIGSGRTPKEDDNLKTPLSSDGNSSGSNQEEIIALFRRIQSSISGGLGSNKKRSSDNSKGKQSAESVLEVLRQSRKQDTVPRKYGKIAPRRRVEPKKKRVIEDDSPRAEFKLTRPPSKFVKRSPIPSLSTPRAKVVEATTVREVSFTTVGGKKSRRIEEMKLTELKELAKSRGIKGYSRLKKGDLVELLKGSSLS
ncbi:PREDICTED: rho-N domain-containing protein 1, chloroplastic [Nelumbo nucifera]|uniref:Rho-N domain-containing protein 1, chloroplastic n=1 Tax=Nelumbo nucifera TaxID=4432 RepID=A0A1U7ZFY5_NELNU|nr:PREDICTED: rho-N domain-containing protein 1, chloroplastic [Nelumbo nucifera]